MGNSFFAFAASANPKTAPSDGRLCANDETHRQGDLVFGEKFVKKKQLLSTLILDYVGKRPWPRKDFD